MSHIRVSLRGFTSFERATFETFFQLTAKRPTAYIAEPDPQVADFIIADADDDAVCDELRGLGRLGRTLMMGRTVRAAAAAQLQRPINLMLVIRALDGLSANARTAVLVRTTTPAISASLAPVRRSSPMAELDHILIVDDSDVALRFMTLHLHCFGFEIHLARSGAEAISKVAERHFEFVFLDVLMDGLDGYQTCRVIKRASYPDRRPPPTVVMVSSRSSAMDKLRGTMAGCDAYLTKPLEEGALLKVIGTREVTHIAFADTAARGGLD